MDLKIRVTAEKVNGNWRMKFHGGAGEDRFKLPKTVLSELNALKPEFEPILDQPGIKDQVESRINEIIEKHCSDDGEYIWVPGVGFMNRGSKSK